MNQTLLGNGLLTSEATSGAAAAAGRSRRSIRDRSPAYAGIMVEYAERLAASWRDGEVREPANRDMQRLTLEIISKTLFNATSATRPGRRRGALDAMGNFTQRSTASSASRSIRRPATSPPPGRPPLDDILYGFIPATAQRRRLRRLAARCSKRRTSTARR